MSISGKKLKKPKDKITAMRKFAVSGTVGAVFIPTMFARAHGWVPGVTNLSIVYEQGKVTIAEATKEEIDDHEGRGEKKKKVPRVIL